MEYASVYDLIAEKFSVRTALYPGSADDMTPSLDIPYVAYIDKASFVADFFRDKDALLQKLDRLKHYEGPCTFDFYAADYNDPLELTQFDLLISRYAGNVGQVMKRYLRDGGIFLVTEGPEDAAFAFCDTDYELIGTVCDWDGCVELTDGIAPPHYIAYAPEDTDEAPIQYPVQRTFCFRKVRPSNTRIISADSLKQ